MATTIGTMATEIVLRMGTPTIIETVTIETDPTRGTTIVLTIQVETPDETSESLKLKSRETIKRPYNSGGRQTNQTCGLKDKQKRKIDRSMLHSDI